MTRLSILNSELSVDPLGRGYSGMTDQQKADSLNTLDRPFSRPDVSGSEIFNATDPTEYEALSEVDREKWDRVCGIDRIDTSNGIALSREAQLFGPGTTTRTNLVNIKNISISRGTEIGIGEVTIGDIIMAGAQ